LDSLREVYVQYNAEQKYLQALKTHADQQKQSSKPAPPKYYFEHAK